MKVVLLRSVDKLGIAGDSVDVRAGYYRNFLGPRQLAVMASEGNLKLVESRRKKLQAVVARERSEAERARDTMSGVELTFQLRANDKGQLFGAVTPSDVVAALHAKGYDIDRRKIELGGSVKTLGKHKARVRLYPEIAAEIILIVERLMTPAEQAEAEAVAAAAAAAAAAAQPAAASAEA